ncbi:MAG TPA: RHS repeat domain-containing protein [Terrimicrobiaceae bacterium]
MNWDEPQSHFKGVSFQGYVFAVEDFGEIDMGEGLKLPLRGIFRSESSAISPYAGAGWDIPLLESHIVQIDEGWFRMVEPTGWFRLFWRDDKHPTVLNGQGGWKAEIRGNTITAWADCGGSKLVYNSGKITQLQIKDRTFHYIYSGSRVSEIREAGRMVLKVESDPRTDAVNGLSNGERKIQIELAGHPQVQVINGQNVVGAMQKSLGKASFSEGTVKSYEYPIDENEKLEPALKIGEDRRIVWDPVTKLIKRDGEWTYNIKLGKIPGSNPAIGRVNTAKEREFWHNDAVEGKETIQGINGVKTITSWFTTGKLKGMTRKIEEDSGGKITVLKQFIYGEDGRLLREIGPKGDVETFDYDALGRLAKKTATDKSETYTYDQADNLVGTDVSYLDGTIHSYTYTETGSLISKTILNSP